MVPIAAAAKVEADRRKAITDSLRRLDRRAVALPKRENIDRVQLGEVSPFGLDEYKLGLIANGDKTYAIELVQSPQGNGEPIRAECFMKLTSQPTGEPCKPTNFAHFIIEKEKLFAEWDGMAKSVENDCFRHSECLRNCVLTISWREVQHAFNCENPRP